jgi:hypothetical protein
MALIIMIIIRNIRILEKYTRYPVSLCSFWKNLHSYEISGLIQLTESFNNGTKPVRASIHYL